MSSGVIRSRCWFGFMTVTHSTLRFKVLCVACAAGRAGLPQPLSTFASICFSLQLNLRKVPSPPSHPTPWQTVGAGYSTPATWSGSAPLRSEDAFSGRCYVPGSEVGPSQRPSPSSSDRDFPITWTQYCPALHSEKDFFFSPIPLAAAYSHLCQKGDRVFP